MAYGTSLHIGLNAVDSGHYAGWEGPLSACEADAESMLEIADAAGYESQVLMTPDATRDAVISGIRDALSKLEAGDIFLVTYSGHGGQVPDLDEDEENRVDETWCLYDGQLIDDELRALWATLKPGVRVFVVSDSCHSGDVARVSYKHLALPGETTPEINDVIYRDMPRRVARSTYKTNQDEYNELMKLVAKRPQETQATVRLLAACQENQLAADGVFNGLFTGTLLGVWKDGTFEGPYGEFHKAIVKRMPSLQTPNHMSFGAPNASFDAERPFEI